MLENRYDVVVMGFHTLPDNHTSNLRFSIIFCCYNYYGHKRNKQECRVPAIGGLAKGQMVREIDVLGGVMAETTDQSGLQFKTLNKSKGRAVWSPRAQVDKKTI